MKSSQRQAHQGWIGSNINEKHGDAMQIEPHSRIPDHLPVLELQVELQELHHWQRPMFGRRARYITLIAGEGRFGNVKGSLDASEMKHDVPVAITLSKISPSLSRNLRSLSICGSSSSKVVSMRYVKANQWVLVDSNLARTHPQI